MERTEKIMEKSNVMEMVATYYRDEIMQINIRMKAFRFHQKALRKEVF